MNGPRRLAASLLALAAGAVVLAAPPGPGPALSVADTLPPPRPVVSPRGMAVSASAEASLAAVRMLEAGGNAVDAAVAAALALGSADPGGSGLGGQTWMVVRLASGVERAIFCPARAPMRYDAGRLRAARRGNELWGPMAAAAPTTLATLDHALRTYGSLPFATVVQPAIEVAEAGYPIHDFERSFLDDYKHRIFDSEVLLPVFLTGPTGESGYPDPAPVGRCVVLPGLARTLRRLAAAGPADFYTGSVAADFEADVRAAGGFLTRSDLSGVPPSVRDVAPVRGVFRGRAVLSVPSPAGGSALVMALQILDALPRETLAAQGLARGQAIVEAVRLARAQAGLRRLTGEVTDGPFLSPWLTPEWAAGQARRIRIGQAIPQAELLQGGAPLPPDLGTTHLSVADAEGNVVSLTQSLGRYYGAAWAPPSLGFPLSSYVELLDSHDRSHPAYLVPGATAPVPVAPAVVVEEGRATLVAGTGGSSRIPSILASFLVALWDGGDTTAEALARPRLLWEEDSAGPRVMLEPVPPFAAADADALRAMGYPKVFTLLAPGRNTPVFGGLHIVLRDEPRGTWEGWVDGRRAGFAAAPSR